MPTRLPTNDTSGAAGDRPVATAPAEVEVGISATERRWTIAAIWLVSVVYVCAVAVADPDLWGHTLYGMRAIEQGVLSEATDPFSYTAAGARWVNHEWLTEYQFGWLWMHFGELGLLAWRGAMVLIVFAVGGWAIVRSRATIVGSLVLLIYSAECLAGFCTFIRPQLATFALLAVTLAILRTYWGRVGGKAIWLLPVLIAIWVNQHGGFLAGVGIITTFINAYLLRWAFWAWAPQSWIDRVAKGVPRDARRVLVGRAAMKMAAAGGLSLGATLLNPYGFELYGMLWHHLVPEQAVREWMPLWAAWQSPMYYVPFVLLALTFTFSRRWAWIDVWLLTLFTFQAISHIRHVALLCIAIMVLLPGPLSDAMSRLFRQLSEQLASPRRRWLRIAAVAGLLLGLLALELPLVARLWHAGIRPWQIAVESRRAAPGVPVRAVSVIEQYRLHGNLITEYSWGQYLIWQLYPESRVAFDGRYRTVYPPEVERHYMAFQALSDDGPATTPLLDDYPSEIVLLRALNPTVRYLQRRDDWVRVFGDEQAELFVRDLPKFRPVIERAMAGEVVAPEPPNWLRFPGDAIVADSPAVVTTGDRAAPQSP